MEEIVKIKRALLSVSNKAGIVDLAKVLQKNNIEIISTGGTRKLLEQEGVKVIPIEEITHNPEAFAGRMKTISFQVGSAILHRRNNSQDLQDLNSFGITGIDLVVCNLYPFKEVIATNPSEEELVENIDIGGPTMVRAAAKNFSHVTCLTAPHQYSEFCAIYTELNGTSLENRKKWAQQAFSHTADYDEMIALELGKNWNTGDAKKLRYGENPHQKAVLRLNENHEGPKLTKATILQGKELSYNNYLDADVAWKCASELKFHYPQQHVAVVVKHGNPCGVCVGKEPLEVLKKAWDCDSTSAFGSIIATSFAITEEESLFFAKRFIEILIAPQFDAPAKDKFSAKKNLRLLETPLKDMKVSEVTKRSISGGTLYQDEDTYTNHEWNVVTSEKFLGDHENRFKFGLTVMKYLKSNAIVLVDQNDENLTLLGSGMGQPNRLDSLISLALPRAKEKTQNLANTLMFSDAFFPFPDTVIAAAEAGIKYIVQPGGSIKDQEVFAAANEHKVAMAVTGKRHFRH